MRRDKGISQVALAAEIGCKQPALSAFEAGDGTKLSDEAVTRLSEMFDIPIEQPSEKEGLPPPAAVPVEGNVNGFCPNFLCPSNVPYVVDGRLLLRPSRLISAPVSSARRCAACGEVLEFACPVCGAPLNDGACCCVCGQPYVTATLSSSTDPVAWASSRRAEISTLRSLA